MDEVIESPIRFDLQVIFLAIDGDVESFYAALHCRDEMRYPEAIEMLRGMLAHMKSEMPDAIVCDLDMPRLRGMDLVRRIRRDGKDLVVVLLSGRFDLRRSSV